MLISGFEKIDKREILDCRIKALRELLRYWGYNISSYELLILCEAITFRYAYINYKSQGIENVPYIVSTNMDIHKCLFEKFNIPYTLETVDNTEAGLDRIKKLIDQGIPVLAELDGSIFMKGRKSNELDMHYISYILVVGYDDSSEEFSIVLASSAEAEKCLTIKYDDFQNSRVKRCFPYSSTGRCFYITEPIHISEEDTKKAIYDSLRNIAATMIFSTKKEGIYSEDKEIPCFMFGLGGINKFVSDCFSKSFNLIFSRKARMLYQLEFLLLRNNMQYGTLTCYREEFKKGLEIISEKYNDANCKKATYIINDSNKQWKKLVWNIGILSKKKEHINFFSVMKIAFIGKKIMRLEKRAFKMISNL